MKKSLGREGLYLELQSIENRGIVIYFEGAQSDSKEVINAMCVNEETDYMRDYVFDGEKLKELRFDRVKCNE